MLPKITELEFENILKQEEQDQPVARLRSFLFDFKKGSLVLRDGKPVPVYGIEALKVWIEATIRTERYKFRVYEGTEHGVRLEDLIGSSLHLGFIQTEIERELTEALTRHPVIQSLGNWSISREGSKYIVSFRVFTIEGAFEQEVELGG
ncbi:DUF2634 domain-containing protein [Bacillus sp. FJAT-45350]|uniref:DUF2634 domain-containing protein n=1 Tax=Bacillus sp. FJAT-45350 TaxID=2011014 RepID=UPI000BB7298F|nr:DUF2634 domain-containing protein [Bacillus sp. FJAT-45350]